MDPKWEAVLDALGPMRAALIEAAFRERVLWVNMSRLAGVAVISETPLRTYIRATYRSDGSISAVASVDRFGHTVPAEIAASVAEFATKAIRDGAESGIDRRDWLIGVPLDGDGRVFLTLEDASALRPAGAGDAPDLH